MRQRHDQLNFAVPGRKVGLYEMSKFLFILSGYNLLGRKYCLEISSLLEKLRSCMGQPDIEFPPLPVDPAQYEEYLNRVSGMLRCRNGRI